MSEPSPSSNAADGPVAAHQPYVPDRTILPEFTWPAVLVGAVLGIVFGASSLYLVLKVGMTVSASIPVAVLSITLFRAFSRVFGVRQATILENNIVQTTGSAGESIAFGVGVTMPAVMILGFEMEIARVMVVSVLGGLLGILMMIPLRRAFIVKQHGTLKYPEGTACADVLIIGETGGATAKTVFVGFGIAFLYKSLSQGLHLWKEAVSRPLAWFMGATPALEADPALLGVGYIIGTKIASIMVAGGILQAFVLVPMIRFFGQGLVGPLDPATTTIAAMDSETIFKVYVKYIGAGAVAAGGIVSLCRALPLIVSSIASGLGDLRASGGRATSVRRTDHDLPLATVFFGALLLVLALWLFLQLDPQTGGQLSLAAFRDGYRLMVNFAAAVLIVLFGFLFVTVSSRLTGEIGSSSNPISGMTIATLLMTCLIFFLLGWTSAPYRLLALSVAAVVCVAASNGGTTSQDLKTGFLVGATPKYQQLAIAVGSVSSALVIGVVLMAMNDASTVYSTKDLPHLKQPIDVKQLEASGRQARAARRPDVVLCLARPGRQSAGRAAGEISGRPAGQPAVSRRPWDQRQAHPPGQRHRGDQVQPTAGRTVRFDYQGHPQPEAAVDPRAFGRGDCNGDRTLRGLVAGIRRGRLSTPVDLRPNLCRRADPLPCREVRTQSVGSRCRRAGV